MPRRAWSSAVSKVRQENPDRTYFLPGRGRCSKTKHWLGRYSLDLGQFEVVLWQFPPSGQAPSRRRALWAAWPNKFFLSAFPRRKPRSSHFKDEAIARKSQQPATFCAPQRQFLGVSRCGGRRSASPGWLGPAWGPATPTHGSALCPVFLPVDFFHGFA